jgi:hypothetical protein
MSNKFESHKEIIDNCQQAFFIVNDNKYFRLELKMDKHLTPVGKELIISGMHKLMRKKESGKLMFLLGCFFMAVKNDDKGNPQAGSYMGVISRVVGRLAVVVMEEGSFLLMNDEAQKQIVRF